MEIYSPYRRTESSVPTTTPGLNPITHKHTTATMGFLKIKHSPNQPTFTKTFVLRLSLSLAISRLRGCILHPLPHSSPIPAAPHQPSITIINIYMLYTRRLSLGACLRICASSDAISQLNLSSPVISQLESGAHSVCSMDFRWSRWVSPWRAW